jgi:P-type Ca2+ transporter type 2C
MTGERRGIETALASAPWHAQPAGEAVSALRTDAIRGLAPAEAAARLARYGPNVLQPREEEPWWKELLESLGEPLQLLLLAVAAAYFLLGEVEDAITILVVILAVSGVEVINELRAKRAVAALSSLSAPAATLVRGGEPVEVPASQVVPGDVALLGPGDRVPADLRLVDTAALRIDESSLTGESAPVAKNAEAVLSPAAELGDRRTMVYAGTLVTAGKGRGVVVATGPATELGRIAGFVEEARAPRTPFQQAMRQLSGWLVWVAIGFSALVPALGVLVADRPLNEMLLVGLTLAFATIPEELPILITIVLGLGAYRLAQRHAIVKHLRAAETLGSVSVVATDKTGTLTENRMRVAAVRADDRERTLAEAAQTTTGRRLLEIGVLANDAQIARADGRVEFVGDPTETALLAAARDVGLDVEGVRQSVRVLEEHPFSDVRKRMSVVGEHNTKRVLAAKGAPESLLAVCTAVRHAGRDLPLDATGHHGVQEAAGAMAARGLRVLALAERWFPPGEPSNAATDLAERELVLLGLLGLEDPPRPEAGDAVRALQGAGVRVLMVTGDHPMTARAVAERVGIETQQVTRGSELEGASDSELARVARTTSVFARIAPEHKLRVVRALQAEGDVVAVTGDGVNDAPALREAAIGVAMGRSGTDVAREAADLVLADDNFATVTEAVRTGRVLYANLRKAVRYYLAAKVALVSSSLAAVLWELPVPFEPVQIIVMELFMDLGASVTFVAEPPEEDVMSLRPRDPRRPFMDRAMQLGIVVGGLSLGAAVLVGYLAAWAHGSDLVQAQTAAFGAWMIGHVVLAAHMRAERQPLLRMNPLANRPFLIWTATAVALLVVGLTVPGLRDRLHLSTLDPSVWAFVLAAALILPSWWEPWKWLRRRTARRRHASGAPSRSSRVD